ncbi:MAG: tetratricopeptide repeat protein [Pseudomonadota bacterium]|nr:tetratricopeptide repeat protein [Pseudomonadota bacterium]
MQLFPIVILLLFLSLACSQSSDPKHYFNKGQYKKAFLLWKSLASGGDSASQNYLGIQYYLGLGVERNLELAKKWYEKAASQDFADAQYNLGVMYENGEFVEQDFITASMWFYAASKNGNKNAKKRIDNLLNDDKLFPNQYNHAKTLAEEYFTTEIK